MNSASNRFQLILSQEKMLPAKSIVVRLRREDVTHHQARPVILREHRGEVQLQFVVQVPAQLLAHTSGLEPRSVVEVVQRNIVLIQPLVVDLVLRLHETLHRALEVPVVQGLVHEDLVVPDDDHIARLLRLVQDLLLSDLVLDDLFLLLADLLDDLLLVLAEGLLRNRICRSKSRCAPSTDPVGEDDARDRDRTDQNRRNELLPDELYLVLGRLERLLSEDLVRPDTCLPGEHGRSHRSSNADARQDRRRVVSDEALTRPEYVLDVHFFSSTSPRIVGPCMRRPVIFGRFVRTSSMILPKSSSCFSQSSWISS